MKIKKILCLLLCLTMLASMLVGCGNQETDAIVEKYEATAIQSQEPRYVPIAEVGTYNKDVVTDKIRS